MANVQRLEAMRVRNQIGLDPANPYDLVGIGFGPSNLALAVAAYEHEASISCLFIERQPVVNWHPGMLIDGAKMQISFLKDLVTLRNPASPYSFLQYVKAQGRLERFVNLNEFRPTRIEYNGYLRWVAEDFSDCVWYGTRVERVRPYSVAGGASRTCSKWRPRGLVLGSRESYTPATLFTAVVEFHTYLRYVSLGRRK